jgi:hypothetical protein
MPALKGAVFVESNDERVEPFVFEHLASADGITGVRMRTKLPVAVSFRAKQSPS